MRIEGNLYEVKKKQALPGGTFNVKCDGKPEQKKAKSGREMLEMDIRILDPVGDEFWNRLTHRITKSDTQAWMTVGMQEACNAFGVPYDKAGFDTDEFDGRECKAVIEQELYEGNMQNRIVHFVKG